MSERAAPLISTLARRGWRIATAESLTGGLLADAFVSVPGASEVFSGGVIAYDSAIKSSVLNVDADLLARNGAVDPDVASQMANGVRQALAIAGVPAHVGLSTTGVAGPGPSEGKPAGTIYVGVSSPLGARVMRVDASGTREEIRRAAVDAAMSVLEDILHEEVLKGAPL